MNYYIYERLFENQNKFQNLKDQVNYTFRELYRIVRYAIFEKNQSLSRDSPFLHITTKKKNLSAQKSLIPTN